MSNNTVNSGVTCPKTAFSDYSNKALYRCYSSEVWERLSPQAKQHLLQETANRETMAYGGGYAVKVDVKTINAGVYGVQNGRNVAASKELVENGKMTVTYGGKITEYNVPDSNWKSLETILHEVRHTWQDEVSEGRIRTTDGLKEVFEANNFTVSDVDGKIGIHYMNGVSDSRMYLLNPTEADSNLYAQSKTSKIIEALRQSGVVDPSMDVYKSNLEQYGYQASLENIKSELGEDADKQVATVLMNIYNNNNEPVDPKIEAAVKTEMVATYQRMLEDSKALDVNTHQKPENKAEDVNNSSFSMMVDVSEPDKIHDNDPNTFAGSAPSFNVSFDRGSTTSSGASTDTGKSADTGASADEGDSGDRSGIDTD